MRNKFGIILLASVVTALCLFYLSFTWVSRGVQSNADEYATTAEGKIDKEKRQDFIDSVWTEGVYNIGIANFTYKEVKESELNLGLDLQGGMHVTLEVSPVEILNALSGNSDDATFIEALNIAKAELATSQENFTTLFFNAFASVDANKSLSSVFANSANRGRIDFNTTDDEIKEIIEQEVDGAIDRAYNVIKNRIDRFGVTQPNIQRIPGTGRIQVELPGVDNAARVRKLLQGVAQLEFLEVWTPQDYFPYLQQANDYIVKKQKAEETLAEADGTTTDTASTDSKEVPADDLFASDETSGEEEELFEGADSLSTETPASANLSPLFTLLRSQFGDLTYEVTDTSAINDLLFDPEIRTLFPPNMMFAWDFKPVKQTEETQDTPDFIRLHVLKKARGGKAPLTGDVIVDAFQGLDPISASPDVSMKMNVEGAKKWRNMTRDNVGNQIAIVLDNYVYSAPRVNGEIPNGSSQISGDFTIEEAQDLANVLKAGKLPAPTRIVEEVVVGPSLGKAAQSQGLISIVAGLALVVAFMVAYYSKGGLVANMALLINIFFIFGVLAQFGAALTLPGIAGIVLTIGMSIDANVLIFERIREELKKDTGNLLNAINLGYERAFWTIFDSNLTTFLTGIFLYAFGSGPIKGFAVTLMVGIACSFFSAVFITRVIVSYLTKKGNESNISFVTPFSRKFLDGFNRKFLPKRKIAYLASTTLIVIGIVLTFVQGGLNLGVDFQGGRSYIVSFTEPITPSQLEVELTDDFNNSGIEVKTFGDANTLKITTNYLVEDESDEADATVMQALVKGVESFTGKTYAADENDLSAATFTVPSTSKVGATIADDIASASRTAGVFSLIALFLYIFVRFRKVGFALGAVVALFHDTLMVFSFFAIARLFGFAFEIDQVFVAAILTIIGYSINDTVVVFDRVREYLNMGSKENLIGLLDRSINSTLNRTLITSVTTLLVVLVLFIFGGEVLRGFSYALLVGIMVGTYSSIFVATPVMYETEMLRNKNQQPAPKAESTSAKPKRKVSK